MKKSERYLERLRREKESWETKLKTDPHIMERKTLYEAALGRIERYNAAKYMLELMSAECRGHGPGNAAGRSQGD